MILDSLWLFTGGTGGVGNGDGTTDTPTGAGTTNSSNIVDVGVLSGLPASAVNGGGARDIGIGDDPAMKLLVQVTVAWTGGTSLQVGVQGAPDAGSNTPGSYTTYALGPAVATASLIVGARLLDIDMPRPAPGAALPRYYRLTYIAVGAIASGKIEGLLVLDRMDQPEQSNAVMGGYPAGITVAN